jgi:deoxyribonuclease-4
MLFKFKGYPPLGAHTSIASSLANAIVTGHEIGCDVIQIFSKNQMQWKAKALTGKEIERFRRVSLETGVLAMTVHDAYLINLASNIPAVLKQSYRAFVDELQRCEMLGVPYLVMHPGSHLTAGEETGLNQISDYIVSAYHESRADQTVVLLETTAGQGSSLGYRFEQLTYIMERTALSDRIAVCVDTCHIFAAGYDIRHQQAWEETKDALRHTIGLDKVKAFHLNDSKKEMGSRVDRHERIGKGFIGLDGFRCLVNDPDFRNIPMILEIPGGNQAYREDLLVLRKLLKKNPAQS